MTDAQHTSDPDDGGDQQGGGAGGGDLAAELDRVKRENASYRAKLREAEKKIETASNSSKTELEQAIERATKAEQALEHHQVTQLRLEVGLAKGLPMRIAKSLTGDTQEDIEAEADAWLKDFPQLATNRRPGTPPAPDRGSKGDGGDGPGGKAQDASGHLRDLLKARR